METELFTQIALVKSMKKTIFTFAFSIACFSWDGGGEQKRNRDRGKKETRERGERHMERKAMREMKGREKSKGGRQNERKENERKRE